MIAVPPVWGTHDIYRKIWAPAEETSSPHFFITPTVLQGDQEYPKLCKTRYSVTHKRTGLSVASGCRTRRQARLIAGAVSGIPFPWAQLTEKRAKALFVTLPYEVRVRLNLIKRYESYQDTPNTTTKEHGHQVSSRRKS